jgi:hypothetical protein
MASIRDDVGLLKHERLGARLVSSLIAHFCLL